MAYNLQWPASSGWVTTPDWTPSDPSNWSFELDIETPSSVSGDKTIAGQEDSTGARCWKLFINNGQMGILHTSNWSGGGFVVSPVTANTRYLVRGEFDGTDIRLYFDDELVSSASGRNLATAQSKSHLSYFGRSGATGASVIADLKLYRAKFWNGALQTNLSLDYDPSASSGTGQTLPDTVGGNDGTLINFPNDDSQWVFYSDGGGTVEQQVIANEVQQSAQSETKSVTFTQQAESIESHQVIKSYEQIIYVTQTISSEQSHQLSQSETQAVYVTQSSASEQTEQFSQSTQPTVEIAQQIQRNEAQQNANAENQTFTLSQSVQSVDVQQLAQAEQQTVQDGGGITANDAQQQSEPELASVNVTQALNAVEASQNAQSNQSTVTQNQQVNAVQVEQFAQAQQSVITDGNGIVAVQVEQAAQAQVSEITQTQQVSAVIVEQQTEAEQALPAISQSLFADQAEQKAEAPTLQVSDSDIIIDPQKISVERVTPTFTIQLVERPKYTIVRL